MILQYITGEIIKSNIFQSYQVQTDELREYSNSLMITAIPGLPIAQQYTRGEKDVAFGFLLTWRSRSMTEEQRLFNNAMFERLGDWMDEQNANITYAPNISSNRYALAWALLDGGMAEEKDEKGNQVYAIQCQLTYHQRGE